LENYHRRTDRHPHVNRDYRWNDVVHVGSLPQTPPQGRGLLYLDLEAQKAPPPWEGFLASQAARPSGG